jgi:glycosyltransferase involved in cell wall biosynthesis
VKIIVLTPVKNEEWILDRYLKACSLFADHIIIADQNSTDQSARIANKYEKVILIKNESTSFNEADRQRMLINKARELFGTGHFLLGLDADEIITADSLNAPGWKKINDATPGTVFHFERPTLYFNPNQSIRYYKGFPMGYKDDGTEHKPVAIHSTRVPSPKYATQVFVDDIKFLHLCLVRKNVTFSKLRYYCILENIKNVNTLRVRRKIYSKYKPADCVDGDLEITNPLWIKGYNEIGLDLSTFKQDNYNWTDFEALRIFNKYGTSRFFNDSIWHFDWEACRIAALEKGEKNIPAKPLKMPGKLRVVFLDMFFQALKGTVKIKNKLFR